MRKPMAKHMEMPTEFKKSMPMKPGGKQEMPKEAHRMKGTPPKEYQKAFRSGGKAK